MKEEKQEVHICPILMRTVVFKDGYCTENCGEKDCPIKEQKEGACQE